MLQLAQKLTFNMDLEEMALTNVTSNFFADDSELRLRGLREEAKELLTTWAERKEQLLRMSIKAHKEIYAIYPEGWSSDELFVKMRSHREHIDITYQDLCEAYNYLHTYLYSTEEHIQ